MNRMPLTSATVSHRCDNGGWFFKTSDDWSSEIFNTRPTARAAMMISALCAPWSRHSLKSNSGPSQPGTRLTIRPRFSEMSALRLLELKVITFDGISIPSERICASASLCTIAQSNGC